MNIYYVLAIVVGWLVAAHTRATATIGGAHLVLPALWLVAAAVVLALAVMVLILIRTLIREGWGIVPGTA